MTTVGSVPYLNAKPLVWGFREQADESPVQVVYAVPSRLPDMLVSGEAQAVLVSSIEALRRPGSRVVAGVSISSQHEVLSVRLFSKVPPDQIRRLALDTSSMTSNALAQIVLAEAFGCHPRLESLPPDLDAMLESCDAAVLIGDNGMRATGEGLHVVDLGDAWSKLTGLPFVWAMWLGDHRLTPELAHHLAESASAGRRHIEAVLASLPEDLRIERSLARTYLVEIMDYDLGERHLRGLARFAELLKTHGIVQEPALPSLVHAERKAGVG